MSSPSHKIEKRQTIQNRERVLETEERESRSRPPEINSQEVI